MYLYEIKPVCLLADNCRCKIAFNQKSIRLQQIGSIKCISSNCIRWTIFSIIFNSLWTFWIQCPRPKMMSRLDTYIWRNLHTIFIERQHTKEPTQRKHTEQIKHFANSQYKVERVPLLFAKTIRMQKIIWPFHCNCFEYIL